MHSDALDSTCTKWYTSDQLASSENEMESGLGHHLLKRHYLSPFGGKGALVQEPLKRQRARAYPLLIVLCDIVICLYFVPPNNQFLCDFVHRCRRTPRTNTSATWAAKDAAGGEDAAGGKDDA